jgi:uncharacterized protein
MIFPMIMAWLYFVACATPATNSAASHESNRVVVAVYALAKLVQFTLPLVWIWYVDRANLGGLRPSFRSVALGVTFGLLAAAAILVVYLGFLRGSDLFEKTPALVRQKVSDFGAASPARFIFLSVFLAGIHSLLEEYYWRWFVFGELQRIVPIWLAIFFSSLAFMGHHVIVLGIYFPARVLTAAIPFSLAVAFGGGVWAWLYHRTGSIYSPWLSHLIVDTALMAVGYDMLFVGP